MTGPWVQTLLLPITWPLSWIYSLVMDLRNWLYDEGIFKITKLEVPVVSIGNLTLGGTGKTPVIAMFLDWCRHHGIRAAVISRGYKRASHGVMSVDPNDAKRGGAYYGDEPFWLAQKYREFQIVVAEDRVEGAELSIQTYHPQLIFLDDGFQHRRLARDIDIVLIDATEPQSSYRGFPLGRLREKVDGIRRAQFVMLTKKNLVRIDHYSELLRDLKIPKEKLIELDYKMGTAHNLFSGESRAAISFKDKPILLMCGIAKPESFLELSHAQIQAEILGLVAYPDHCEYTMADVEELEQKMKDLGCGAIVCTQKDAVKLKALNGLRSNHWWAVDLHLQPIQSLEPVYESLRRVLH
ncbi:MAG: tetraacyldisaccharide 4'-kinase [Bdellovibrionales bacterium]|nr:tetraacyldisaccharide 4'-kinase [Bdellovibrionales bacterium]